MRKYNVDNIGGKRGIEMTNEEAINTINSLKQYYNDKNEDSYVGFDNEDNEALTLAIKALEHEPKTGHWIAYTDHQACSCCGEWIAYYDDYNYCPNCGRKMKVIVNDND